MLQALILMFWLFPHPALANDAASQDVFQKALSAYQNKAYPEARDQFQKLTESGPVTAELLHNWALTELQLDNKAMALALWRRALALDPSYSPARRARDLLESKMQIRSLESDGLSAWLHRTLEAFTIYQLLWINALMVSIFGWLAIRYLAARRIAVDEEGPMPAFPTTPVLVGAVTALSFALVILKIADNWTPRGTVVVARASAKSLPSESAAALFDLNGGREVLVRRDQDGWLQVQSGDGNSGWVKNTDVMVTSER